MPRNGTIARRVEHLLGVTVVSTAPVSGGSICIAAKARLANGRVVFVKTLDRAPADFFAVEAVGLRWLADADGVAVPEVIAHDESSLVLGWVPQGRPTTQAAGRLGAALARLHRAGAAGFGTVQLDGTPAYIGAAPLVTGSFTTWSQMYAEGRVVPYLRIVRDRDTISRPDADDIESVLGRLDRLAGPPEPPARIHGDLWSGNVCWSDHGEAYVIDPAAQGGHRETDLAMLTLFGAPHLDTIIEAYEREHPLADGWRDRVPLHQIHPLLVHAVLFGGGYGARAGQAARATLRR